MNELIKIQNNSERPTVSGRELHSFLEVGAAYKDWFPRMVEYGFTDGNDFCSILSESTGGRPSTDHQLTLDMAKELCMIQRTEKGKQARHYFIEAEKALHQTKPLTQLEIMHQMTGALLEQDKQLKSLSGTIDTLQTNLQDMRDAIVLDPTGWREECRKLVHKIALAWGGPSYNKEVWSEIYKLIDARAGVSLETRLTNKRRRMADEGVSKSRRDALNGLDIVGEDKKLVEITLHIIKQLAIKHGAA